VPYKVTSSEALGHRIQVKAVKLHVGLNEHCTSTKL